MPCAPTDLTGKPAHTMQNKPRNKPQRPGSRPGGNPNAHGGGRPQGQGGANRGRARQQGIPGLPPQRQNIVTASTLRADFGDRLLLLCRAGFEEECGEEVSQRAADQGIPGRHEGVPDSGLVQFLPMEPMLAEPLSREIKLRDLIFTRDIMLAGEPLDPLPEDDRIGPILEEARAVDSRFSELRMETPDNNEARSLLPFCARLGDRLKESLDAAELISTNNKLPRLHVLFETENRAWVAVGRPENGAEWPMGIPRLRMPEDAPSRATLKIVEAATVFLDTEHDRFMKPGMRCIDLGAAPGGWSLWLASKGLLVTAVDNGDIADAVIATDLVEHVRDDAFTYQPEKPGDWMVCDVVAQPSRIAKLMADWIARGWCRNTIFNLKLPMKQRLDEVERCRQIIVSTLTNAGINFDLRFKQLYHDREEITGFLRVNAQGKGAAQIKDGVVTRKPPRNGGQGRNAGQPRPAGDGQDGGRDGPPRGRRNRNRTAGPNKGAAQGARQEPGRQGGEGNAAPPATGADGKPAGGQRRRTRTGLRGPRRPKPPEAGSE